MVVAQKLNVLEKATCGPYQQKIELDKNMNILIDSLPIESILVHVSHLDVSYFVEILDTTELIIHGQEVVKTILKDFNSGKVEYID